MEALAGYPTLVDRWVSRVAARELVGEEGMMCTCQRRAGWTTLLTTRGWKRKRVYIFTFGSGNLPPSFAPRLKITVENDVDGRGSQDVVALGGPGRGAVVGGPCGYRRTVARPTVCAPWRGPRHHGALCLRRSLARGGRDNVEPMAASVHRPSSLAVVSRITIDIYVSHAFIELEVLVVLVRAGGRQTRYEGWGGGQEVMGDGKGVEDGR
jgi:hypothetical protein